MPQDLQKVVALTPPGTGVPVTVWRDKTHKTMEIKIGDTPDDTVALKPNNRGKSLLGLELRPLPPESTRTCPRCLAGSAGGRLPV